MSVPRSKTTANMPRAGRFQINAKNYFITYPRCSLTKEEAQGRGPFPIEILFLPDEYQIH
uniref:Truncated AC1 n=1 Tax=East African cassava mosaic virus TaxID=62079 RepID=A0A2S1PF21_9GEMI|nr:truncated AC1 [East African cassava mosaic virus]